MAIQNVQSAVYFCSLCCLSSLPLWVSVCVSLSFFPSFFLSFFPSLFLFLFLSRLSLSLFCLCRSLLYLVLFSHNFILLKYKNNKQNSIVTTALVLPFDICERCPLVHYFPCLSSTSSSNQQKASFPLDLPFKSH